MHIAFNKWLVISVEAMEDTVIKGKTQEVLMIIGQYH